MRVLILSTAFSGMAQRVLTELQASEHEIEEHYDLDETGLIAQVKRFQPHVIVCPFLTQRIPTVVWKNYICLIVHPGIEGDRGPSSLDWAISEGATEWGVTLLQADDEYDAGDIWGTRRFPMRRASKTSIYKREVTQSAIELIKQALHDIEFNNFSPRPLDYDSGLVKGKDRPLMRQKDRLIEWQNTPTDIALQRLNAADSRPGVRGRINGIEVNMFGAVEEPNLRGRPGDILGIHNGAFCCATQDGAVWIKQLKCSNFEGLPALKLPASQILNKICSPEQLQIIPPVEDGSAIEDIRVEIEGECAYLYFDFYNGAMNTAQCLELKNAVVNLKDIDVKMIVLMGGENFWSNGIHLNCIEASDDPGKESWNNINAIDDLVRELIDSPNHIIVSALRNNAGAGGVVLASASDEVIIRQGVVLNPHYKTMGLYGSEYWTYLLPRRVGQEKALEITEACLPVSSSDAIELGLADVVFEETWDVFHQSLREYCSRMLDTINIEDYLRSKAINRQKDEDQKPLSEYRSEELAIMKKIFFDDKSSYHDKRRAFVYKLKTPKQQVQEPVLLKQEA